MGEALWIILLTGLVVRGPISALFTVYSGAAGGSDFEVFYNSGASWLSGGSPYGVTTTPNLTLPHLMPVFALLAALPFAPALTVWLLANTVAAWTALRMVRRSLALELGPHVMTLGIVLALVTLPAMQQLRHAQVGWLVMAVCTLAWIWTRGDRPLAGAALIGALITVKSFFLLWVPYYVIRRRWREAGIAALTAAAIIGSGIILLGPELWREWQRQTSWVWFGDDANASVMGVLARTLGQPHPPTWLWAIAVAPIVLMGFATLRRASADIDRDWLIIGGAAILLSPIGWVYYECFWVGPFLAVLQRRGWQWRDLLIVAVLAYVPATHDVYPPGTNLARSYPAWVQFTTGSIACWSLLAAWVCLTLWLAGAPRRRVGLPVPPEA